ncbi:MAG: hypothetical protein R2873_15410 [Caldilineaceae bacterium]
MTPRYPSTPVWTLATNTTGNLTGTADSLSVSADPAVDVLDVDVFAFAKQFDGPTVQGGTAVLTFTLSNRDPSSNVAGLAFTDDLDAVLSGLTATGLLPTMFAAPARRSAARR